MGLCVSLIGIQVLVAPIFGEVALESPAYDYMSHVALVAAARQTWASTHLPPLSSDAIYPGTEYPYFLFGNIGFYLVAGFVSWIGRVPAYIGAAWVTAAALAGGVFGILLLARSAGLNRIYGTVLGFLYATGPYLAINLLVRSAIPEFVAWELLPLIYFACRQWITRSAHRLAWIAAALALSIPLYIHKLVGPHIILFVLAFLALNAPWRIASLVRFALLGLSIPCLTVFAWLPVLTIDRTQIEILRIGAGGHIAVLNESLVNFLWPWAVNSLPEYLNQPLYADRFALQLGVVPTLGIALAIWRLGVRRFRSPIRELYAAPLAAAVYTCLVLGIDGATRFLPFPLDTIQFSYRLIGLAHFAGFLALIAALGDAARDRHGSAPSWMEYAVAGLLSALAVVSISTYWRFTPPAPYRAANVDPSNLIDQSAFFSKSYRSTLDTGNAITQDGWLIGSGGLVPLKGEPSTVVLLADVPTFMFDGGAPPLAVRALGTNSDLPQAPRTFLAEAQTSGPGPLELRVTIPDNIRALAIECSRVVSPASVDPSSYDQRVLCARVIYLGPPNDGAGVLVPQAIPANRVSRSAIGNLRIATANLPGGDYMLPTFDYSFVQVTTSDGRRLPTYQFNSRPVIKHDGFTPEYLVNYDLHLEWWVLSAWIAGAILALLIAQRSELVAKLIGAGSRRRQ